MKHKKEDRPVEKRINIPTSLATRIDAQLIDPVSNRPEFGAWSRLVTSLLISWLKGDVRVATPIRKPLPPFCHICLIDQHLFSSCNNKDCPFTAEGGGGQLHSLSSGEQR